jgi:hypothetical protein
MPLNLHSVERILSGSFGPAERRGKLASAYLWSKPSVTFAVISATPKTGRICCGASPASVLLDVPIRCWPDVVGPGAISFETAHCFNALARQLRMFASEPGDGY